MAWQDIAVPLVRGLINDMDESNYTYSDILIKQQVVYAAHFLKCSVNFTTTYTIDIPALSITPDPDGSSDGNCFINLSVLKAACQIMQGEVKTAAAEAIKVTDGPSSMDISGIYKAKKDLYDQMCEDYERAKLQAQIGDFSTGEAVLTPYTQEGLY